MDSKVADIKKTDSKSSDSSKTVMGSNPNIHSSFAQTAVVDGKQVPLAEALKAKPGSTVTYAGTKGTIGSPDGKGVKFLMDQANKGVDQRTAKAKAAQMGISVNQNIGSSTSAKAAR